MAADPKILKGILTYNATGNIAPLATELANVVVDDNLILALTRVGGSLLGGEISAVDPDVAQGFAAVYAAVKNPGDHSLNTQTRNTLDALFAAEATLYNNPPQPQKPKAVNGPTEMFAFPVQQNQPVTIDPPIAWGYEYAIGEGDPQFNSVILPLIGNGQKAYEMQICRFHRWVPVRHLKPLNEYHFRRPGLSRFRIVRVKTPTDVGAPTEWISAVSFTKEGAFSGSITTLTPSVDDFCSSED
jgi:hypothetical protein